MSSRGVSAPPGGLELNYQSLYKKMSSDFDKELNSTEIEFCMVHMAKRNKDAKEQNCKDGKVGDQSLEFTSLQGVAGEMYASKCLNVFPDLSAGPGKHDIRVSGIKVDVKTTACPTGHLLVKYRECYDAHAQIFMLVVGDISGFRLAGWQWIDFIAQKKYYKKNPKNGKYRYKVPQKDLLPLEELV